MKIQKLVLQNVKSFRDEVSIEFKKGLNVFIGPNTGGKSNLMDILNISLGYYFVYPWRLTSQTLSSGLIRDTIQEKRNLFNPIDNFLDKNLEIENHDQKITIHFEVTDEDLENLEIIKSNRDKLVEFEKKEYGCEYLNNFVISDNDFQQYKKSIIEYQINNYSMPKVVNQEAISKLFLQYLNYFELFFILIEEYNRKTSSDEEKIVELFPLTLYFSPYRTPAIQNLRISIAGQDRFTLIENYKKNTSKDTSSVLEYANFYFALKLRNYDDKLEIFKQDGEVKFIQKYIKKLGYSNFEVVPIDKQRNIYEITLKKGQKDIEITRASSGEKEILNLLLGIFAFNVKGGIVIIDEPELHLHPRWQRLMLDLFYDLSRERKIQFFIVTHSPQFITTNTLKNTFRVYKENDASSVFIPKSEDMEISDIKDIFQIVNALNNEKIFFADKVILVEGVVDRIIYERVLKILQKTGGSTDVIEIVEVYGKENFGKFKEFLKAWDIKSYIFADLDYSVTIGSIDNQYQNKIFILKNGEIEDYFGGGHFDIKRAIKTAQSITQDNIPEEFKSNFSNIFNDRKNYAKEKTNNM